VKSNLKKNFARWIFALLFVAFASTFTVEAQRRRPRSTKPSPNPPANVVLDERLIPRYEYDRGEGITRVFLGWSSVEGISEKGADVRFTVRYLHDDEWRYIGHLNDVMIYFMIIAKNPVCSGVCTVALTLDGLRKESTIKSTSTPKANGIFEQQIINQIRPEAFKTLAAGKALEVEIGTIKFRLTKHQMEAMRQMIPFMKVRALPF
jgi:hypothetical protein